LVSGYVVPRGDPRPPRSTASNWLGWYVYGACCCYCLASRRQRSAVRCFRHHIYPQPQEGTTLPPPGTPMSGKREMGAYVRCEVVELECLNARGAMGSKRLADFTSFAARVARSMVQVEHVSQRLGNGLGCFGEKYLRQVRGRTRPRFRSMLRIFGDEGTKARILCVWISVPSGRAPDFDPFALTLS